MTGLRTTRTYATTNICIFRGSPRAMWVYAEDFSIETDPKYVIAPQVAKHVDAKHLRVFQSMREFSEWCFEHGVVVDECAYEVA